MKKCPNLDKECNFRLSSNRKHQNHQPRTITNRGLRTLTKQKKTNFAENHGLPNSCTCYSVRLRTRWIRVNLVFVGCPQALNFELRGLQNLNISSTACLHSDRRIIRHFDGFLNGRTGNTGPHLTSGEIQIF